MTSQHLTKDELGESAHDFGLIDVLRARYLAERQELDFQMPSPVSHVDDHAGDPERLKRYAASVIPARITQLMAVSFMKMQLFLEGYAEAIERDNSLVMFMCTRAAVEAFAVCDDAMAVVRRDAGTSDEGFLDRVGSVDAALINATYGSRHPDIRAVFESRRLSKLREPRPADVSIAEAKNILTRVDRLTKSGRYPEAREDYDLVSEYLHPNIGQNLILLWPSPRGSGLVRYSPHPREAVVQAARVTARPMARAARGVRDVFQAAVPPFGISTVVSADHFHNDASL